MLYTLLLLPFVLLSHLCTAAVYIVDGKAGDDANNGLTTDHPLKTIGNCVKKLAKAGDECQIRDGRYHEVVTIDNLRGKPGQPIKITGYKDERPIWDGTELIQPAEWKYNENTKICTAVINKDITALFYENDLLTLARWPNARWSDRSIFLNTNWRKPSRVTPAGTLADQGLAELNLNVEGAMAILGIGPQERKTVVREVLSHDAGSDSFTYRADFGALKKFKSQQYYLESKLNLLDSPEEWFYDKNTRELHVMLPEENNELGPCPDPARENMRGRTIDFGIEMRNSRYITIANMVFFGANIRAYSKAEGVSFDSIDFMFPTSSHRALQSEEEPLTTKLSGHESSVINCTFLGSDGDALQVGGKKVTVLNNQFSYNDWVGTGKATVWASIKTSKFSQNTLWYNGVSPGIRYQGRGASELSLNYMVGACWGQLRNDGASFQVSPSATTGVVILKNWIRDSPKKGIRFDGELGEKYGTISHNVVWNIWNENQEIYPKGDYHNISNNIAFADDDKCTVCVNAIRKGKPNNRHSVVLNNGATAMGDGGGQVENNYESKNLVDEMIDVSIQDFRPVPGGHLTQGQETIGAYEVDLSKYWIPGRQLYKASFPIPPNGSRVKYRTDVIFQVGFQADQHHVYLGESEQQVEQAGPNDEEYKQQLTNGDNICTLPALEREKTYYWRIDTQKGDDIYKGDIWSFSLY